MERDELIPAIECCTSYNIEYAFIAWLSEHELLEVTTIEEQSYIPLQQLTNLEQYIRFYNELDINLEGIEAISHLLQRVRTMQDEIRRLKNQLQLLDQANTIFIND